jgi:hypothetical protein
MAPTLLDLRIDAVDAVILTPVLQSALNRNTIKLTQWHAEPISVVRGGIGPSVVYRFTGSVESRDQTIPWSLILKVLTEPVGNQKREVEFYRSNLAQAFLPGLRPAHCYSISEQIDETGGIEYWLWLEELSAESGVHWTLDDHQQAAQHFGQFQGAFLVDRSLPSAPWLDSSGVRRYLEKVAPWVAQFQQHQNHQFVQHMYPPAAAESFLQCWQNRLSN